MCCKCEHEACQGPQCLRMTKISPGLCVNVGTAEIEDYSILGYVSNVDLFSYKTSLD